RGRRPGQRARACCVENLASGGRQPPEGVLDSGADAPRSPILAGKLLFFCRVDAAMSLPMVSVIIPVYNDAERLPKCLAALEAQTSPSGRSEGVVIDNGSGRPAAPLLAGYTHVRASYEGRPSQYAARNRGLSLAQGEVLAFTDADCVPAPGWIERGV